MEREAWYAAVRRVTKSQTGLRYWTELNLTQGTDKPEVAVFHHLKTATYLMPFE